MRLPRFQSRALDLLDSHVQIGDRIEGKIRTRSALICLS
jgi:hypothetical protein